jgi:hypothetical protein
VLTNFQARGVGYSVRSIKALHNPGEVVLQAKIKTTGKKESRKESFFSSFFLFTYKTFPLRL